MSTKQLDPKCFTKKQRADLLNLFDSHFEKVTKDVQDEYLELELHPNADPDKYNYLCDYLDDKFKEELWKFGLYDIFFYREPGKYTIDELEEWDDVTIKYYDNDTVPREFLTESELPF